MVDELWDYVIDGTIDMIASDHSPHTFDKKVVPPENFSIASEGVMGLQTMIPVIIDEGVIKRQMPISRLAEITAFNPARRFGLYPRKGSLSVGADADFYIVDLEKEWECKAENMFNVNKHTPFDGRMFEGRIEKTFVRGQLVFNEAKVFVRSGFGQFIPMKIGQ
jgi:dihydroorotase-like cyclic amidohydrolase